MIDEFDRYHPIINFIFFAIVCVITMCQTQIVMAGISFVCAAIYFFSQNGMSQIKYFFMVIIMMIVTSLINPLFSHRGATLLFYSFTGNPITLESVLFGLNSGVIVGAMLLWFLNFNRIITSDKILAVVGSFLPSIAMMMSMIFRFVPKFIAHQKRVSEVKRALNGNKKIRWVEGIHNFSITTTWALENSIDTANSMNSRGYGIGKRTNYNNYRIEKRDILVMGLMIILGAYVVWQLVGGRISGQYYPQFNIKHSIKGYITYGILCLIPVLINIKEELRWHKLKSKI